MTKKNLQDYKQHTQTQLAKSIANERQMVLDLQTPNFVERLKEEALKHAYLFGPTRPYRKRPKHF